MKQYTKAKFLSEAGKKTPVFTRFSTVVGFRSSYSPNLSYDSRVISGGPAVSKLLILTEAFRTYPFGTNNQWGRGVTIICLQ